MRNRHIQYRFEVFTALTKKNAVFWDVTHCGSCKNLCIGGTYRLKSHTASHSRGRYFSYTVHFSKERGWRALDTMYFCNRPDVLIDIVSPQRLRLLMGRPYNLLTTYTVDIGIIVIEWFWHNLGLSRCSVYTAEFLFKVFFFLFYVQKLKRRNGAV
jgi:hypothetical protein